jgi:hypothetical protein
MNVLPQQDKLARRLERFNDERRALWELEK